MELFLETEPKNRPLPGHEKIKRKLREEAINVMKGWEKKFVKDYVVLKLITISLKNSQVVNYAEPSAKVSKESAKARAIRRTKAKIAKRTLEILKLKFETFNKEARISITQLNNAINLLVPNFTELENEIEYKDSSHQTAIPSSLTVVISNINPEIVMSPENDGIVETIMDLKNVMKIHVKKLKRMIDQSNELKTSGIEEFRASLYNLQRDITKITLKAKDLKIIGWNRKRKKIKIDEDEEDEFVDVDDLPVDDFLIMHYNKPREEEHEERVVKMKAKIVDPDEPSTSNSIPLVPYGLDLKYWGEERSNVQITKNNSDCHRFWRAPDEDTVVSLASESIYTQRLITYVGKERKSDKVCRAKMKNGSLCPRRDFERCPLHGAIVERDDFGNPLKELSSMEKTRIDAMAAAKRRNEDAKIAKDIQRRTGIDIIGEKWKTRRRRDVEEISEREEVRKRLEKKLFDPGTVKRVSQVLDASQKARLQKKFGQQFAHL
ncbi:unnamed protein product [Caenorhabditis bovis]|uniref:UV-stimulated scaffold protein A C-terminal domain-containing protein n=1 Tax=Caenorhabditis bovis TaxID=2654633 RepID=A0A8S1E939_9PELO|nr:unnamed protein product [Caenorhabditis bovis]